MPLEGLRHVAHQFRLSGVFRGVTRGVNEPVTSDEGAPTRRAVLVEDRGVELSERRADAFPDGRIPFDQASAVAAPHRELRGTIARDV
ncbi:MAG: hypothetical protein AAB114_01490, partial [Chloroflexota bacterium]